MDLERRVTLLSVANALSTVLLILLAACVWSERSHARVSVLDAERVNIVGTNGQPVLALSNRPRLPGPTMNGTEYPAAVADGRDLVSGMIFFNEEGDEVGGLIFNGFPRDDGGHAAIAHLSFDQWKQNQVLALQCNDNGRTRGAGLNVWDRPTDVGMSGQLERNLRMLSASDEERAALRDEAAAARERGEYGVQRLFVGSRDQAAQVQLHDTAGRLRAQLYVDANDVPRLEFLDESGTVVAAYPEAEE
ncbi:MAG: hypothetical protein QF463_02830 [Vicinamibacterales bacterium]|nr:hypothetical protein [Acidobacteriota bacterium]MDP6371131.1 hypothetical protein [Vicinamibacterales bacterium]MDP6607978.1 hypothetical protein [Vicinamibacterales bacterium]